MVKNTAPRRSGYEVNAELISLIQGDDAGAAEAAAEELIKLNTPLVRSIALRFRERGVEQEDLMQIGTLGLLKAARSFDISRGNCFSTYAVPMIFGEIRRSLRDEGPIKVSRYYKRIAAELMRARHELLMTMGKEPRLGQLAETVGISVEEAAAALDAMAPPLSFSDFVYGEEDGTPLEDTLADADSLDANERFFTKMALQEAIDGMEPMWQRILLLRYFKNMTQQQVADLLGLSQVKISREEKKIVAFLREKMS